MQLSAVNDLPLLNFYDTESSSDSSDSECQIVAVSPNSQATCSTIDSQTINNLNTCQISNNHFDNNSTATKRNCTGRCTPIIYNGRRTNRDDVFVPIKKNEIEIEDCSNDNNNIEINNYSSSTKKCDDDAMSKS